MKKLDPNCMKLGDQIEALVSELKFLRLEAENMALSLEAAGFGTPEKLCTPLSRYRKEYPRPGSPPEQNRTFPEPHNLSIEIIVRPIPYRGTDRRIEGSCSGASGIRDNSAIAYLLRAMIQNLERGKLLDERGRPA